MALAGAVYVRDPLTGLVTAAVPPPVTGPTLVTVSVSPLTSEQLCASVVVLPAGTVAVSRTLQAGGIVDHRDRDRRRL